MSSSQTRLAVRRAAQSDVGALKELLGKTRYDVTAQYGSFSFEHLIEASVLAIVVHDETQDLVPVAFAAFLDAPPPSLQFGLLSQDQWPEWLDQTFYAPSDRSSATNTLWMVSLIMDGTLTNPIHAGDQILHTVFATLPHIEAVLALVPLEATITTPIVERFKPLQQKSVKYFGPRAFSCGRSAFIPPVQTRRARVEDHDDLVPILNEQTEVLTQIYGEFFLASVIENQNDHNVVLVADAGGGNHNANLDSETGSSSSSSSSSSSQQQQQLLSTTNVRPSQGRSGDAVGLISVTDLVDVKLLNACFDLSSYDYLLKSPEAARIVQSLTNSNSGINRSSGKTSSLENNSTSLQRRMNELYCRFVEAFGGGTFREFVGLAALAESNGSSKKNSSTECPSSCSTTTSISATGGPSSATTSLSRKDDSSSASSSSSAATATDIPFDITAMSDAEILKILDSVDNSNLFAMAALTVDTTTTDQPVSNANGELNKLIQFRIKLDRAQAIAAKATKAASVADPVRIAGPTALIGAGAAESIGSVTGHTDSVWLESNDEEGSSNQLYSQQIASTSPPAVAGVKVRDNLYAALTALIEQFISSELLKRSFTEHGVSQSGPRVHFQQSGKSTRLIVVPYSAPPMFEVVKAPKESGGFGYRATQAARVAEAKASSVMTSFHEPIITSNPKINAALDYVSETLVVASPNSANRESVWSRKLFVETLNRVSELLGNNLPTTLSKVISFFESAVRSAFLNADGTPKGALKFEQVLSAKSTSGLASTNKLPTPEFDENEGDESDPESDSEASSPRNTALANQGSQLDPWSPNAVAITLYCIDEAYEPRAIDLIEPLFSHFPHIEYCVLTQPHASPERGLLKHFVPVPPRPNSTLNHTLYLIHRSAVKPKVCVGWSKVYDILDFASMLSHTAISSAVLSPTTKRADAINRTQEGDKLSSLRAQLLEFDQRDSVRDSNAFSNSVVSQVEPLCFSLSSLLDAAGIAPGTRAAGLLAQVEAAMLDEKLQRSLFYQEKEQRKAVRKRFAVLPKPKSAASLGMASDSGSQQSMEDLETISAEERLDYETARPKRRNLAVFTIRNGPELDAPIIGFAIVSAVSQDSLDSLAATYSLNELVALSPLKKWSFERHQSTKRGREDSPSELPFGSSGPIAGELLALILNPLFSRSTSLVCQEIMRLFHKDVLLMCVPADAPAVNDIRPVEVFVQTKPRHIPSPLPSAILKPDVALSNPSEVNPFTNARFALHAATRRLLAMPKTRINARVVVIGASDTSLGFLEALALNPDVHCSSLTIISPDGLPSGRHTPPGIDRKSNAVSKIDGLNEFALNGSVVDAACTTHTENEGSLSGDVFLPWSLAFSRTHLSKLVLNSKATVLNEAVVSLDANAQEIVLSSGRLLPYDFLVVGTGLQDCTARRLGVDVDNLIRGEDVKTAQELLLPMLTAAMNGTANGNGASVNGADESNSTTASTSDGKSNGNASMISNLRSNDSNSQKSGANLSDGSITTGPVCVGRAQGLWTIPTEAAAQAFAKHIKKHKPRFTAVVGCTLQALTTIQGLLKLNVKPCSILWIHDDVAAAANWCDGDRVVASQLLRQITEELGIQTLSRTRLVAVRVNNYGMLNEIVLERLPDLDASESQNVESTKELGLSKQHRSSTVSLLNAPQMRGNNDSSTASLGQASSTSSLYSTQSFFFSLQCECVVTTGELDIDPGMMQAFLENSFVLDGKLVVNHHFSIASTAVGSSTLGGGLLVRPTSFSPHFAAGPICRFSRRYGETPLLSQFDSREVGEALAQSVLRAIEASTIVPNERSIVPSVRPDVDNIFNTRTMGWNDLDEDVDQQTIDVAEVAFRRELCAKHGIPPGTDLTPSTASTGALREKLTKFWLDYNRARRMHIASLLRSKLPNLGLKPKTIAAELPGGLVYVRISDVSALMSEVPVKRSSLSSNVDDIVLLTNDKGRVCRLVIDGLTLKVKSFVYIGPTAIPIEDFTKIVGLPVTYLNNLLERYRKDQVKDLVSELTQPWAAVIQHESFVDLRTATSQALANYLERESKDTPVMGSNELVGHFEMLISSIVQSQLALEAKAKESVHRDAEQQSKSVNNSGTSVASELAHLSSEVQSIISQAVTNMHLSTRHTVQTKLLEFIHQNADHLPGFQIPPSLFKSNRD